ncbi:hypothetical protein D3C71_1633870 [compost metagenome]
MDGAGACRGHRVRTLVARGPRRGPPVRGIPGARPDCARPEGHGAAGRRPCGGRRVHLPREGFGGGAHPPPCGAERHQLLRGGYRHHQATAQWRYPQSGHGPARDTHRTRAGCRTCSHRRRDAASFARQSGPSPQPHPPWRACAQRPQGCGFDQPPATGRWLLAHCVHQRRAF